MSHFTASQSAKLTLSLLIDTADALTEEDHGTTGTTERLMGGGHDKVSVFKWRGKNTGSNETFMNTLLTFDVAISTCNPPTTYH